jgi:exodeoxyribonuclease VII small subunit
MTKKQLTYSDAIAEIEVIVDRMENGELDIDELTTNVKRVAELLNFCKAKLKSTEEEVQKILKDFDDR